MDSFKPDYVREGVVGGSLLRNIPTDLLSQEARSLKFIATCVGKIYKQQKNKILTEQNLKIVATYLGKNSDSNRTGLSHRFDT